MFSLFLVPDNGQSMITIGGYNLEKYARSEINWHPLNTLNYWSLDLHSTYFGDKKL